MSSSAAVTNQSSYNSVSSLHRIERACLFAVVVTCGATGMLGCGSGGPPELQTQQTSLRQFGMLYMKFQRQNRGLPPQDDAQLRSFFDSLTQQASSEPGVNFDDLLKSPSTGKPLVVVYGSQGPVGPDGFPLAAYESEAVGGRRLVVSARGNVLEIDESDFRQLVPGTTN